MVDHPSGSIWWPSALQGAIDSRQEGHDCIVDSGSPINCILAYGHESISGLMDQPVLILQLLPAMLSNPLATGLQKLHLVINDLLEDVAYDVLLGSTSI